MQWPVRQIAWINCEPDEEIKSFDTHAQKYFFDKIVDSKLLQMYPLNKKFCQKFFKKVINILEPSQEVYDMFYTYLCLLMELPSVEEEFSYCHYSIDSNTIVTIKENNKLVTNGTTGLRTWDASFILLEWILSKRESFNNKTILELGSGVGFMGISIAKLCKVKSMIFTDCHDDVLKTIADNITINFPNISKTQTSEGLHFRDLEKIMEVKSLDWCQSKNINPKLVPDILIGADIIYDPLLLPSLSKVIKSYLNLNKQLEVYIAIVVRNRETLTLFLDLLDSNSCGYKMLKPVENVDVNMNNSESLILNIYLN